MNMHFKDADGNQRIVAGEVGFIQDQKGLRKMIKALGVRPAGGPILGVIRGGKFKVPDRFAIPQV